MRWWSEKGYRALKDIIRPDGHGWRAYQELWRLRRARFAPQLYARLVNSIPWDATPGPAHAPGQWLAQREEDGIIQFIYHLQRVNPPKATLYKKEVTEQLTLLNTKQRPPPGAKEIRIVRTIGPKNVILDFNPTDDTPSELLLWLWGNQNVEDLEWDPKEWSWRRLGILPVSSILNYTTKRGYQIALRQDNHQMPVDAELELAGMNSKTSSKFFNRIWHPYLPRKVSAHQWLILTEGLPVGAWRKKLGQNGACQICAPQERETLIHAFAECEEVTQIWVLFRTLRRMADLPQAYTTWQEISRGLITPPNGPNVEADLQWDTAAAFSINVETPWDILRAQLLWAIWCQRVAHAFNDERFHIGMVLWYTWCNTIYCAIEAYKELRRHKRNEEIRQEQISCFQEVWTAKGIFGRLHNNDIKWHLAPPPEFLPQELGAWMAPPINILRRSPTPDSEADFAAHPEFPDRVQEFLDEIGNNFPVPPRNPEQRADSDHTQHAQLPDEANNLPIPSQEGDTTTSRREHDQAEDREGTSHSESPPAPTNTERRPLAELTNNHSQTHTLAGLARPPTSRGKTKCKFGPKT